MVRLTQVDGVTIVDLSGRITLGEASVVVRDVINDLMGNGNKKIVLNLAELVNITKRIRDLLQIIKLYSLFDIRTTRPRRLRHSASLFVRDTDLVANGGNAIPNPTEPYW
jgi:hypothetical protein